MSQQTIETTDTLNEGRVKINANLAEIVTLKAPLASPVFTGTPTTPTAAGGTNTTQIASTAFVRAEVASLVASAPAALDTLNELAAALGGDANFAATVTTALGTKVPITRTINGHALSANVTITKADLSLGNVENTALSTWAGSTNLVTLGTAAISGLTEDASPSVANDFVMTYDASAAALKKVKLTNLGSGGSAGTKNPSEIFVRSNGSDSTGTGTAENPYQTIQGAYNAAGTANGQIFNLGYGDFGALTINNPADSVLYIRGIATAASVVSQINLPDLSAPQFTIYDTGYRSLDIGFVNATTTGDGADGTSIIVIGAHVSGGVSSIGGAGSAGNGGNGGGITLEYSIIGSATSTGGASTGGIGGQGGGIEAELTECGSLTSTGGASDTTGGIGGAITITRNSFFGTATSTGGDAPTPGLSSNIVINGSVATESVTSADADIAVTLSTVGSVTSATVTPRGAVIGGDFYADAYP